MRIFIKIYCSMSQNFLINLWKLIWSSNNFLNFSDENLRNQFSSLKFKWFAIIQFIAWLVFSLKNCPWKCFDIIFHKSINVEAFEFFAKNITVNLTYANLNFLLKILRQKFLTKGNISGRRLFVIFQNRKFSIGNIESQWMRKEGNRKCLKGHIKEERKDSSEMFANEFKGISFSDVHYGMYNRKNVWAKCHKVFAQAMLFDISY